ncbi:unnamed protein product [Dicrocoelium dendriticum]|nr:unnamed protein product [Dicrocoelium dendriticum]
MACSESEPDPQATTQPNALRAFPLSPTTSTAMSETDPLASPTMEQGMNSSPSTSVPDHQSSALSKKARKVFRQRVLKARDLTGQSVQETEMESTMSPLTSDGGQPEVVVSASAKSVSKLARHWRRTLLSALSTICSHRHAYVFMNPVTEDIAPGYSSVVFKPVDLTTIRRKLETTLGSLSTTLQPPTNPTQILIDAAFGLVRDIMLMFANARMYNSQNHEVHKMALDMFNDTVVELQPLWSVLVEDIPGFPPFPESTRDTRSHQCRVTVRPPAPNPIPLASSPGPQTPQRAVDPVLSKPPLSSSTRQTKRLIPETPSTPLLLRKRRQSDGDAPVSDANRSK